VLSKSSLIENSKQDLKLSKVKETNVNENNTRKARKSAAENSFMDDFESRTISSSTSCTASHASSSLTPSSKSSSCDDYSIKRAKT